MTARKREMLDNAYSMSRLFAPLAGLLGPTATAAARRPVMVVA